MQKNITITSDIDAIVKENIAGGLYNNASEFWRDAARTQDAKNKRNAAIKKLTEILEKADIEECTLETLDELLGEVKREIQYA